MSTSMCAFALSTASSVGPVMRTCVSSSSSWLIIPFSSFVAPLPRTTITQPVSFCSRC